VFQTGDLNRKKNGCRELKLEAVPLRQTPAKVWTCQLVRSVYRAARHFTGRSFQGPGV